MSTDTMSIANEPPLLERLREQMRELARENQALPLRALRVMDDEAHPWDKPGEWPEVGAKVWVTYRGEVHETEVILSPQEQEDDVWEDVPSVWLPRWEAWFFHNDTDPDVQAMRFRKRWTPEAP